ncbi:hypothetical protein [Microvirga solisilvae]|uniref:hypothetical protein n=1 Tax=Microvirga solisilvae TaxID=2919498 RepID=UPI001FAEF188|nr:hypothetical protein [Microvirga solisilvae]
MIIALLALASAMILGGLLAAFFGWDIVLIERGWTMVLAGSFSAACGAVLLGITAAVSKLSGIQAELARLQFGFDEEVREEAPQSSTGLSMAALAGGLLGGRMFGRGEDKAQQKTQDKPVDMPSLVDIERREPADESLEPGDEPEMPRISDPFLPFPPRAASDEPEHREDEEDDIESKVPDFLLAERLRETYVESRGSEPENSLFADEPRLDDVEEERRDNLDRDDILAPLPEPAPIIEPEPEPELEPVRGPEPELAAAELESVAPEEPAREESIAEEQRPGAGATVIGTYNSGDNTYVMFSDGSIEAQTPGGLFHFKSLDELKAFIASGGEGGTSAT